MQSGQANEWQKTKPRVWLVAAGFSLPAGIEAHVLYYATAMRNHGFDMEVVVFHDLPDEKHRFLHALESRKIPISSLKQAAKGRAILKAILLFVPWLASELLFKHRKPSVMSYVACTISRAGLRELQRRIKGQRPDIIHLFGRQDTEAWALFPPERTIFHEMMTGTVDEYWSGVELDDFRQFAENCARYFAPGSGVAENVKREFGIKRDITPIYTICPDECGGGPPRPQESVGRTMDSTAPQSGSSTTEQKRFRFGVLCRLCEQKGIKYILEALRMFREKHGNVDFTFAGQGPLEGMIQEFIGSNGLTNVRIQRVETASTILNDLDVFVHPSIDDAMPVSIAEALMCGLPCICSDVGGIPDLVRDGQEGFIIEPRSPDLILKKMEQFADMSEEQFDGYRKRARARYEECCTPEKVGAVVASHYREILRLQTTDHGLQLAGGSQS